MSLDQLIGFLRSLWSVWVMVIFIGIVFWAYRPKNRGKFESYGDIPLKDDNEER